MAALRLIAAIDRAFGVTIAVTAAGAHAFPLRTFCAVVFAGRALRFALLVGAAVLAS